MNNFDIQTSAGLRALADAIDAGALTVQSQTLSQSARGPECCKIILYVTEIDHGKYRLEGSAHGHAVRTLSTAGASDREIETNADITGRVPSDPRAPWLV